MSGFWWFCLMGFLTIWSLFSGSRLILYLYINMLHKCFFCVCAVMISFLLWYAFWWWLSTVVNSKWLINIISFLFHNELAILEFMYLLFETADCGFGILCEPDIMFHLEKSISYCRKRSWTGVWQSQVKHSAANKLMEKTSWNTYKSSTFLWEIHNSYLEFGFAWHPWGNANIIGFSGVPNYLEFENWDLCLFESESMKSKWLPCNSSKLVLSVNDMGAKNLKAVKPAQSKVLVTTYDNSWIRWLWDT